MNDNNEAGTTYPYPLCRTATMRLRRQYRIYYKYQSKKSTNKDRWDKYQAYIWALNETEARETFRYVHRPNTNGIEIITRIVPFSDNLNLEEEEGDTLELVRLDKHYYELIEPVPDNLNLED